MSGDDTVHIDMIETFRLLTPASEPDLLILRLETQDGKKFNFGCDRSQFAHVAKVWAFDLGAMQAAIDSGAPLPGKEFGLEDRKAS